MADWINLSNDEIDADAIACISRDVALDNQILPLRLNGNELTVGIADPTEDDIVERLCFILNREVSVVGVHLTQLKFAIWRFYGPRL
jgi:hypothetical protein